MSLRIYNTQTGNKEPFNPITPGKVGMYVCGVTVYDLCHIGHARSQVVFDVIYRYLRYAGFDVTYVRNFTDVDDKIINRANEQGMTSAELAQKYIDAFYEDMDALGILHPDVEPRATGHIQEMIVHIERLIAAGNAYEVEGDVYFSVDSFKEYGHLSGRNLEDLLSGARIEVDDRKRNPLDFALWKATKPGEPFWESPWGKGRPGWHIECTVMGQKYLGETFDIHGGGKDLVFPHHENESAQAEAATGKPFVKYWMHNGFVNIDKEKMSKSLGNFFTIRDVLEKVNHQVMRFFLLSHHYRSPIDYSDSSLREARAGLDRFYTLIGRIEEALAGKEVTALDPDHLIGRDKELYKGLLEMFLNFDAAMDDDFNTAGALGHLHKFTRQAGNYLHEGFEETKDTLALLGAILDGYHKVGSVLGLFEEPASDYFAELREEALGALDVDPEWVEQMIIERKEARANKDWGRADEIRDLLTEKKIVLEDGPEGTTWKIQAD
ncbi:MAG: cysteine--tRNA ligase [Deltaproteobacteria bacterium]|nr:MAG: cysteine--tRNA ligase [Deltaproteobacteria bacterium]